MIQFEKLFVCFFSVTDWISLYESSISNSKKGFSKIIILQWNLNLKKDSYSIMFLIIFTYFLLFHFGLTKSSDKNVQNS